MNERDELAEVIANFRDDWYKIDRKAPAGIDRDEAAHILAAGYSKPRTITTREEIAALPEGSVLIDSAGDVAQLRHGLWCSYETAAMTHGRMAKYTPATVLYEPEAPK